MFLLCEAWLEDGIPHLPDNDDDLAALARVTPDEWGHIKELVLSKFQKDENGMLVNERQFEEWKKQQNRKQSGSKGGSKKVANRIANSVATLEDAIEDEKEAGTYSPESRVALHYLNEKSGKHFRECESSLAPINARLKEKGVDIAGVKKMIERQCQQWKGGKLEEYLRPQTLFGKEKFDGYYAAKDQPINYELNLNGKKPVEPVRGSNPVGGF